MIDANEEVPRLDKPMVLGVDERPHEMVSNQWLWILAGFGCSLMVLAIILALNYPETNAIWRDVALNFGSTILLFSVLFYVERRFVRRVIRQAAEQFLRALRADEPVEPLIEKFLNNPNSIKSGAALISASEAFSALVEGRFNDFWEMSEHNWRLCRAQAWIWNNRAQLGLFDEARMQVLADELSKVESDHHLWRIFMEMERDQWFEAKSSFRSGPWGISTGRRCVAPGYELFQFSALPEEYRHGLVVSAATLMPNSSTLLVHLTPDTWRVAAVDASAPPHPGWPPAWWRMRDPVAETETDQMELATFQQEPIRE